jgi:hypothetical protein
MLIRHWPLNGNTDDVSGYNNIATTPNKLAYSWYTTTNWYNANAHPTTTAGLDAFFNTANSGIVLGGTGFHNTTINWSTTIGSKPTYLPADFYSWMVEGLIYCPIDGTYTFKVNSDDAADVFVNNTLVSQYYGGHGMSDAAINTPIFLNKGFYQFRARFEEGGGGDGIEVTWIRPGDLGFSVIPADSFFKFDYTSGKIGQAASFNGTNTYLRSSTFQRVTGQEITVATWFRQTNRTGYQQLVANRSVSGDYNWLLYFHTTDGSIQFHGAAQNKSTNIPVLNQWNHVVATVNSSNVCKVYLNGTLVQTVNSFQFGPSGSPFIHIGASYPGVESFSGSMNDVRIYDHAISEYEVKELAKANILHHTFNNPVRPFTNQVYNSSYVIYNNFGVSATLIKLSETFQGSDIYRLTMTPTSGSLSNFQSVLHSTGIYGFSRTFLANTKYIFTILWRPVTHFDLRVGGVASNIGNWIEVPPKNKGTWTLAGQYRNGTAGSNQSDAIFTSFFTPSAAVGVPISIDFACPTLIVGTDDLIDYVDYDNSSFNIVSDSSGLFNNSTLSESTSPQWTIDSKIGSGNYVFNNSRHIPTNITRGQLSTEYTIASWFKYTGTSGNSYSPIIGSNDFGAGTEFFFGKNTGNNNFGVQDGNYIADMVVASNVFDGNWHHFAFSFSSGAGKLYLDGNLASQNTFTGSNASEVIYIGLENEGPGYFWIGSIDDTRFYTTVLSDSDILSLYNRRANFDNLGNVQIDEFIEDKNLAPNPGFEIDNTGTLTPSGWTAEVNTGTQLVNIDNRKALLFPGDGTYRRIRSTKFFPVTPGSTMYGKILTRRNPGAQFYFGLYWENGTYSYFTSGGADSIWTLVGGTVIVPAGVNSASIWVFNFAGNSGALYIDDVYVSYDEIPNSYPDFMLRNYVDKYKINSNGQIIAMELDEVTGTQNTGAQQEITNNGTLFINGEFSEVD